MLATAAVTYVDFGPLHPEQTFSAHVPDSARALFPRPGLAGRPAGAGAGAVFLQDGGRPTVLVTRADDLRVLDGEGGSPERRRD